MQSPAIGQHKQQLTCPNLPLGVYREVAAHLRQVQGVDASLILRSIEHDESEKFDYYQSQVAALEIKYTDQTDETAQEQVAAILDYYARRYKSWVDYTVYKSKKLVARKSVAGGTPATLFEQEANSQKLKANI